jgi:hypothetical protein
MRTGKPHSTRPLLIWLAEYGVEVNPTVDRVVKTA